MFTLVSYYDSTYQPLMDKTWHNNKVPYCNLHGYSHDLRLITWNDMRSAQIAKIQILQDVIGKIENDSWIWWTGGDLMITNFKIKLEDIADTNYHLIIASDFNGINSDSFLLRNSPEGRDYLNMIAETLPTYTNWEGEQGIMKDTYEKYKNDLVKLVPQKVMNSYNYSLYRGRYPEPLIDKLGTVGDWSLGDFVIQWPATDLNFRLKAFDYYSQFIIR